MTSYEFPARFKTDPAGGFTVTFRDIPEAITQGDTREEAESMAIDALITAMDFYIEQDRVLPQPSPARRGETIVALPLSICAKMALLGLVKEKQVRPANLAKAMGIKPQEVTRLLDLHHATKIDTVAAAFKALDKRLQLQVA